MISEATLKYLVVHRIKDAHTLLNNKRYSAAIYLAGYAIEIALKYRICKKYQFVHGFPETSQELRRYLNNINEENPLPMFTSLGEIRNHDLDQLLFHSGEYFRIKNSFEKEWKQLERWSPSNRYKKLRIIRKTANSFLQAVNIILKEFV